MNDKVISLHGGVSMLIPNESDIVFPVGSVLKDAEDADLDSVVIIGDKGEDVYVSSALGNMPRII